MNPPFIAARGLIFAFSLLAAAAGEAQSLEGSTTLKGTHAFSDLVARLEASVANHTFAAYRNAKIDEMTRELDPLFDAIGRDAVR